MGKKNHKYLTCSPQWPLTIRSTSLRVPRTVGRKSVLSHDQSPQQDETGSFKLYTMQEYTTQIANGPILHHQTANCGEVAVIGL